MKIILSMGCFLAATLFAASGPSGPRPSRLRAITQGLQWRLVGPHRGGRTRAITGVPGQPHTFLAGAVNGGVWKSDDDGPHVGADLRLAADPIHRRNRRGALRRRPSST